MVKLKYFTKSMQTVAKDIKESLITQKGFCDSNGFALLYHNRFFRKEKIFEFLREELKEDYIIIEISREALNPYNPKQIFEEAKCEVEKDLDGKNLEEIKKGYGPLRKLEKLNDILKAKEKRILVVMDLSDSKSEIWTFFRKDVWPCDIIIISSNVKYKSVIAKEAELSKTLPESRIFRIKQFFQTEDLKNLDNILLMYHPNIPKNVKQKIKEYIEENLKQIDSKKIYNKLFELMKENAKKI